MDVKSSNSTGSKNRYDNILNQLSKCKIIYIEKKNECKSLSETNCKLQQDINQISELEKSLRNSLLTSREMINSLQNTVSQLVYLKVDMKKLKEEITTKDSTITTLQKEQEHLISKHNDQIDKMVSNHRQKLEEADAHREEQIIQIQHDTDTQLAQFTCVIEELRAKIREIEAEYRDKMNIIVLEYEEKLQKSASEIALLKDQHAALIARADANIEAYRRRLEEIEEKLKNNHFKQFLAQNSSSLYESPVERPYSAIRDTYDLNFETNQMAASKPTVTPNIEKPSSTISKPPQVNYHYNEFSNSPRHTQKFSKKGVFTISKKRKLFSEKDIME